jgi:hypothetical protein
MERPVMEEFARLVVIVNTGGPAVMNANKTAMKTEETTINRLFPHALSADTRDQPALSLQLHQR